MRHTPILLGAAIAAILVTPVHAASYAPGRWAQIDGLFARSVAIGDLNWDKLDDLVVFSDDDNGVDKIQIYLQQPNGTLTLNSSTLWSNALSPSIALADIDYDSEPEILVGSAAGFWNIQYNHAYGNFYANTVVTPYGCEHVAVADLDSDHYADVVCQSPSSGATVWHNAQNGTFPTSANVETDRIPGAVISLADLTGDGKIDLLLSTPGGAGFAVHPHSSTWSFGAATRYPAPSTAPISTSGFGDLNHDGRAEALIVSNATAPDAAVWSYGVGTGGLLAAPLKFMTSDAPVGMLARDLDRDGRDDLVVANAGGSVGVQMQGGAYAALAGAALFTGDSSSLAAGDLDNDGCTDIAYATTTGSLAIAYGSNCMRVRARSDFDGDGHSDLLWSNVSTRAGAIWKAADSSRAIPVTRVVDPAWFVLGTGDFNGDGRSDMLWRNDSTGAQVIWYSGNSATYKRLTTVTDLAWKIVGIGDFDGNGCADVLWRHAISGRDTIWRSGDSSTLLPVSAVTNLQWTVAGVGDFDGDGQDDILWRNPTTWANAVWRSGRASMPMTVASNSDRTARVWVGDFNGDRHADLLWAFTNGDVRIWLRPDNTVGQQNLAMSADWRVVSTGDFDGNGTVDLVWRNMKTGQDSIWRSASSFVPRAVSTVSNFSWVIVR
jgi:hypothetical protein